MTTPLNNPTLTIALIRVAQAVLSVIVILAGFGTLDAVAQKVAEPALDTPRPTESIWATRGEVGRAPSMPPAVAAVEPNLPSEVLAWHIAQETNCGECENLDHFDRHIAASFDQPQSGWGPGWKEPTPWHWWSRRGSCVVEHGICVVVALNGKELDAVQLTGVIVDAVTMGNLETLAQLVKLSPVAVSIDRQAIQVFGCDEVTIAGHVPVDPELLEAIQAKALESESK